MGAPSQPSHEPLAKRAHTDWFTLAVAMGATLLLVQLLIVQPLREQVAAMQSQVGSVHQALTALSDESSRAGETASLLTSLANQAETAEAAGRALDRFADLETKLADTERKYGEVQSRLERLAELPAQLNAALEAAGDAAPSVSQAWALRDDLAEAVELSEESLELSRTLLSSEAGLASRAAGIASARAVLVELLELEAELREPAIDVALSRERLEGLVGLKRRLITQTDDLPAAVDTLALMAELRCDFDRAMDVLAPLKAMMTDLVMIEPSIARVAASVAPSLERDDLARLGGGELRMVLRELRDRHASALQQAARNSDYDDLAVDAPAEPEAPAEPVASDEVASGEPAAEVAALPDGDSAAK
ncbi:hypothetical protein Mal64_20890 [Pseudobythopirellula maris]|uniref:Uncharacterized protein n=2 Tax=Pseudobythopirellula maris TaxID=2527991 RepID=A0A5C5ZMB2_9BACT|nr:hypothetical protein Mal64_20890 [Pseudobythopirellula maris]